MMCRIKHDLVPCKARVSRRPPIIREGAGILRNNRWHTRSDTVPRYESVYPNSCKFIEPRPIEHHLFLLFSCKRNFEHLLQRLYDSMALSSNAATYHLSIHASPSLHLSSGEVKLTLLKHDLVCGRPAKVGSSLEVSLFKSL